MFCLCLRGQSSTPLQRSEVRPAAICFSAKFCPLGQLGRNAKPLHSRCNVNSWGDLQLKRCKSEQMGGQCRCGSQGWPKLSASVTVLWCKLLLSSMNNRWSEILSSRG